MSLVCASVCHYRLRVHVLTVSLKTLDEFPGKTVFNPPFFVVEPVIYHQEKSRWSRVESGGNFEDYIRFLSRQHHQKKIDLINMDAGFTCRVKMKRK